MTPRKGLKALWKPRPGRLKGSGVYGLLLQTGCGSSASGWRSQRRSPASPQQFVSGCKPPCRFGALVAEAVRSDSPASHFALLSQQGPQTCKGGGSSRLTERHGQFFEDVDINSNPPRSDSGKSEFGLMFRFWDCLQCCRVTYRRILEPATGKAVALM